MSCVGFVKSDGIAGAYSLDEFIKSPWWVCGSKREVEHGDGLGVMVRAFVGSEQTADALAHLMGIAIKAADGHVGTEVGVGVLVALDEVEEARPVVAGAVVDALRIQEEHPDRGSARVHLAETHHRTCEAHLGDRFPGAGAPDEDRVSGDLNVQQTLPSRSRHDAHPSANQAGDQNFHQLDRRIGFAQRGVFLLADSRQEDYLIWKKY